MRYLGTLNRSPTRHFYFAGNPTFLLCSDKLDCLGDLSRSGMISSSRHLVRASGASSPVEGLIPHAGVRLMQTKEQSKGGFFVEA